MAAGLPCVVSGVRGNTDLIQNGTGGFIYEPNDVEGFANGIRMLLENQKLRKQFGERNRIEIEKYSLPKVLEQTTALYREQLEKRGDA